MLPRLPSPPSVDSAYLQFLDQAKAKGFTGDISTSYRDRLVHATDNSIYQVLPQAVCFPKTSDDISCLLKLMGLEEFRHIKAAPRGGGTGTNGQSLTSGLVIDCSRHMRRVLEINLEQGWARVEAGVVLDQLNAQLKPLGFFFAPDLSPSNRATIGGMVNTDACGKGSRVYGKTSQHILELHCHILDGQTIHSKAISKDELSKLKETENGRSGLIYQTAADIVEESSLEIAARFPKLTRFLTGYNLAKLWDEDGRFNLNYLISGSEGTLAYVSEIKVKLTPIPKFKCLILAQYDSFDGSLRAAKSLCALEPAAIETVDDTIIGLAKNDEIWHKVAQFFPESIVDKISSVNLIECIADDQQSLERQVASITSHLEGQVEEASSSVLGFKIAQDQAAINALWSLRKKGVGLLGNRPGARRPIAFVEDTVVPPEHLADYIKEFRAVLDSYGLSYGMFGHVDVGCLHVRPALDLKDAQDERLIREITTKVRDLVVKYGGVLWGEHGKGFRSEYVADFFGPKLHHQLRRIKASFDPHNQLNPGKLVTPEGRSERVPRIDEIELRASRDRGISEKAQDSFAPALHCNGNGACFTFDTDDVMCPSYKHSRDRLHSPKGRAGMLREWLAQLSELGYEAGETVANAPNSAAEPAVKTAVETEKNLDAYDFSHEVYTSMDACLSCKACTNQCPIKVDIPEMKARFLQHYHTRYKRPKSDYLIASAESLHAKFTRSPALYNLPLKIKGAKAVFERLTGMVDPPMLSSPSLYARAKAKGFDSTKILESRGKLSSDELEASVIIVSDAVTGFYEADLVIDIMEAMRLCGFSVYITPFMENGKAKHVKGFLEEFKTTAKAMDGFLRELSGYGIPMVGIDPAITLSYREEYKTHLGPDRGDYEVLLIHEWLKMYGQRPFKEQAVRSGQNAPNSKTYALLGHCGEKTSSPGYETVWVELFKHFGLELIKVPVGCCGMAGAYGHEKRHYEDSRGIYELSWKKALINPQRKKADVTYLATGASCRSQVKRFDGVNLQHPLQALLEHMQS